MNDQKRTHRSSFLSDPGSIAPSVDKTWRDDFILELRLLDVPGDRIGDHLMTVETHVADSGESAQEAFGDAAAYARELVPDATDRGLKVSPLIIVGNLLGLLGIYFSLWAFGSWLDGGPAQVFVGTLVSLTVLLGLVVLVAVLFVPMMRFISDRPAAVGIVTFLLLGALVGLPMLFLQQPLFDVAPWVLGVLGILLLVVSSVMVHMATKDDSDEITAPGETPKKSRAGLLAALMLPLATVVGMVLVWIPTLFA